MVEIAADREAINGVAVANVKVDVVEKLRLGSLVEDGLSYKEKFVIRCYEVGINKTATVETIANLLQVFSIWVLILIFFVFFLSPSIV